MTSQIPRHVSPTNSASMAKAPYNFVPLPQAIFEVEERLQLDVDGRKVKPWECHDQYVPGTHSGWLDLSIQALTPLFIRGAGRQRADGTWDDSEQTRQRAAPFLDHLNRPMIPGSSLRGMIRNLVEILTFSKIQPVSNEKPFFRTVADDRVGRAYRDLVLRNGRKPNGGVLERRNDDWIIIPAMEVLRVPHSVLPQNLLNYRQHPGYMPDWRLQQQQCWFRRGLYPNVSELRLQSPNSTAWEAGTLVLTGSAPRKRREFVLVGRDESHSIEVPHDLLDRFHDDDQITPWQQRAFPSGQPKPRSRRKNGDVHHGEPVFYVCNDAGELIFFGRAQMFRFPYDESPASLIPKSLREAGLDLTEAMFGRVATNRGDTSAAIKGRVYFEDSVVTATGQWLAPEMIPQILGSPKVTAYQQYLTQNGKLDARQHTTYIKGDTTTIRGHKLYWHRWDEARGPEQASLQSNGPNDTQTTLIQPVAERNAISQPTVFTGRIRFENLTDVELGALLSALNLPEGCAHKIGMAKPLGLGSIRIKATLQLTNRAARYQSWSDSGTTSNDGISFVTAFTSAIKQHATQSKEARIVSKSDLRNIARLDALFCLLRFDGRPDRIKTEYLTREQFEPRHVLPTPHQISGEQEPDWLGPISVAPTNTQITRQASARLRSNASATATLRHTTAPKTRPSKLSKGAPCQVIVNEKKRKKIEVYVEFASDQRKYGYLSNPEDVPEDQQAPGCTLDAVFEQSTSTGWVFRFVASH